MRLSTLAILLLLTAPASAHEWYDGWCCNENDCDEIQSVEVETTLGGWHVKSTGEVLPYDYKGVLKSKDRQFHRCVRDDGSTRCLYVPPAEG